MPNTLDCLIVGAGFSGIALATELKKCNCTFRIADQNPSVGGTWFTNRYPGARCDTPTVDYAFHQSPLFDQTWQWSEDFATQPEILEYLQQFTNFEQLQPFLLLNTKLSDLTWDEKRKQWQATFTDGKTLTARFIALALGSLSKPFTPTLPGHEQYEGQQWHTAQWPDTCPSFRDKSIAVVGTGASGIQLIPELAKECKKLYVIQRTPSLAMPASDNQQAFINRRRIRKTQRKLFLNMLENSRFGSSSPTAKTPGTNMSDEELETRFDICWRNADLFAMIGITTDLFSNIQSNRRVENLFHQRLRSHSLSKSLADTLLNTPDPFGTKRICIERGFYASLSKSNVQLIDVRDSDVSLERYSIHCSKSNRNEKLLPTDHQPERSTGYQIDAVIYATGFEAFTGAILDVDIQGCSGVQLKDFWVSFPKTIAGIFVRGFPNLFLLQGPGSPSVLTNMAQSAQVQARLISQTICNQLDVHDSVIEVTSNQEIQWMSHNQMLVEKTLFYNTRSWYSQKSNVNPQSHFLPYVGGIPKYEKEYQSIIAP